MTNLVTGLTVVRDIVVDGSGNDFNSEMHPIKKWTAASGTLSLLKTIYGEVFAKGKRGWRRRSFGEL